MKKQSVPICVALKRVHTPLALALTVLGITAVLPAALVAQSPRAVTEYPELIPQHLLGLVHAPEVHQELKLNEQQVTALEGLFEEIDGPWFRARILPDDKRYPVIAAIEQRLLEWLASNTSREQQQRLKQLEYRAQGIRMLLRTDIIDAISLDKSQVQQLATLAKAKNDATVELQKASMQKKVSEDVKQSFVKANEAEQNALKTVIRPDQMQKLSGILGEPFDTTQLKRIYPMAPEFVSVENWINSGPLTLKELRGKVVVVHFYAFQCYNCHNNFKHYIKWHDEFNDDQVVVIGIQTPELPSERNPTAVREAAKERKLEFPILVDLESKNWTAWSNTMWPTVYVIDKKGYLRHWWQGELNWDGATGDQMLHSLINELIQEEDV